MPYGLKQEQIDVIVQMIAKNDKVEEIVLFGSRAKGNYREGSDIDICIKGKELHLVRDVIKIQIDYDELWMLYKLDIVVYNSITEPALVEHIDKKGITLFKRQILTQKL